MDKENIVNDGLENVSKRLGTWHDPASHSRFVNRRLSYLELDAIYSSNAIAAKIIDIPVNDALQKGRYIAETSLTDGQKTAISEYEQSLQLFQKFGDVAKWSRLYGGAVLLIGIQGENPAEPLNIETVKRGGLEYLVPIDASEISCTVDNVYDLSKPNYRQPEFYDLNGVRVHHTRVVLLDGVRVPYRMRAINAGFGLSLLQKIYDDLKRAQNSMQSADALMYKASIDVVKIPGLFEKVMSTEEESAVIRRFHVANELKGVLSMLVLDSEEDFSIANQTFAGITDVLTKQLEILCASADIPATRLLGTAPGGLNATGESDLNNYYDSIKSLQENDYKPKLYYLDRIIHRHLFGAAPNVYRFEFNPLRQMSAIEVSTIEQSNANRDKIYFDMGVITPEIIVKQLREEETYSAIDTDYIDALESMTLEAPVPLVEPRPVEVE
jgi:phage-related protein (TIGR01555 family)